MYTEPITTPFKKYRHTMTENTCNCGRINCPGKFTGSSQQLYAHPDCAAYAQKKRQNEKYALIPKTDRTAKRLERTQKRREQLPYKASGQYKDTNRFCLTCGRYTDHKKAGALIVCACGRTRLPIHTVTVRQ